MHRLDENMNLYGSSLELAEKVRTELDKTYKFQNSSAGVYMFDPWKYDETLSEIIKRMGHSKIIETILNSIEKCKNNTTDSYDPYSYIANGLCYFTNGWNGLDYIILIAVGNEPTVLTINAFGEEIMHGEHVNVHKKSDISNPSSYQYFYPFSKTASEFIGGFGHFHFSKITGDHGDDPFDNTANFIPLDEHDKKNFYLDYHDIPYELAKHAMDGEDEWKSSMFHAPTEKKLWSIYNEVLIPDIEILVPPAVDNKNDLKKEIDEHVKSIGLKCNVNLIVDESDTRGMKN